MVDAGMGKFEIDKKDTTNGGFDKMSAQIGRLVCKVQLSPYLGTSVGECFADISEALEDIAFNLLVEIAHD